MVSLTSLSTHPVIQLLDKCITLRAFKQVHAQAITTGLAVHTYPLSRILLISSALSLSYALSIFNQIPNPTIFLFNTLISSIINHKHHTHIAFSLYNRILSHKTLVPNRFTYPSLFKACGSSEWAEHGQALHTHVLKFLESPYDHFVQSSLLVFYAKLGQVGTSRYLFNEISNPDLASWNSILTAYARNNGSTCAGVLTDGDATLSLECFNLFRELQGSDIRPNEVTLVAVISACANLGALAQGVWVHAYLRKHSLQLNLFVATALVDMYSKCGCLDLAYQLFILLPQRDVFCYNAMIGGFGIHGYGHQALDLFNKIKVEGLNPDDVTFVVTISACSHVGLVEEGRTVFNSMKEIFKIEPKLEHYSCLVDLLGRVGQIVEAEEIVRDMPMKPNAVVWRSLLGAAKVHGNLAMGEVALKKLLQLEPAISGNYVLLSNLYARMNRWDDVNKVRRLMKDHTVDKVPGSSLVEIDGAMHEFLTGDRTHPRIEEVHSKLDDINRALRAYGHKPSIGDVLFDIEDEEKEDALSYHSERLAIAFALIMSDPFAPIRVIKNLRVCSDCHSSTKLISLIYGREIIVRDRTRFHHFRYGTCSCSDYW
ncbi:hypothetical protein NL676_021025 [Syzygium grande]|nr:hypothetical protein NL676_021025 [Syzygium grande]